MLKIIDKITDRAGLLSAWMFFAIGVMVTYEVVMRKAFNAPTVWVDEVARFVQIWAVYLAGAYVLKNRHLITVELFADKVGKKVERFLGFITLTIICIFCLVAVWYGSSIVYESIERGRHTSTMLGTPKWITESAIPIAFSLLLLQTLVEFYRLAKGEGGLRGTTDADGDVETIDQ